MERRDGPLRRLSPRQAELAHYIGHHLKNPQIATAMGLATSTVKNYIQSLALLFADYQELKGAVGAKERIRLWVDRLRLDLGHVPSIEELIAVSRRADAPERTVSADLHSGQSRVA